MLPIREAEEHVPRSAWGSPHNGMPASEPVKPAGSTTWTPARSCSRSSRWKLTVNGENWPAFGLDVPASKTGLNGSVVGHAPPFPSQLTSNGESGVASGVTGVL